MGATAPGGCGCEKKEIDLIYAELPFGRKRSCPDACFTSSTTTGQNSNLLGLACGSACSRSIVFDGGTTIQRENDVEEIGVALELEKINMPRPKNESVDEAAHNKFRQAFLHKAKMVEQQTGAAAKLQGWLHKNGFVHPKKRRSSIMASRYPLHVAAEQNNVEIAELLLQYGASSSDLNIKRQTPRQVAETLALKKENPNGDYERILQILAHAERQDELGKFQDETAPYTD